MPILDTLAVKLGFEYDSDKLDDFNEGMDTAKRVTKGLALAGIGLATSLALVFVKLSQGALAQSRFAKTIGVTREELVAFNRTSEELTGDATAGQSFLETLANIKRELLTGKTPSVDMQIGLEKLGVTLDDIAKKDPTSTLIKMLTNFQKLDEQSKDATHSFLGLSSAQRTLAETFSAGKFRANLPTKADLKSAADFAKTLLDVKQAFNDAVVDLGTPLFKELIPAFKWISNNTDSIVEGVGSIGKAFKSLGTAIGESLGWVMVNVFEPFQKFLKEMENFWDKLKPPAWVGHLLDGDFGAAFEAYNASEPIQPTQQRNRADHRSRKPKNVEQRDKTLEALRRLRGVGDQSAIIPNAQSNQAGKQTGSGDISIKSELNVEVHAQTGEIATDRIIEAQKQEMVRMKENLSSAVLG